MSELMPKPCPFCDTVPGVKISHYDGSCFVSPSCCIFQDGTDLTIEQWNNRPGEDKLHKQIAALKLIKSVDNALNITNDRIQAELEARINFLNSVATQALAIQGMYRNELTKADRRINELEAEVISWESTR